MGWCHIHKTTNFQQRNFGSHLNGTKEGLRFLLSGNGWWWLEPADEKEMEGRAQKEEDGRISSK